MSLADRIRAARTAPEPTAPAPIARPAAPIVLSPFVRRALAGTLPAKDLAR